jgi:integrase
MSIEPMPTVTDLLDAYERDCFPRLAPRTQYQMRYLYVRWRREMGHMPLTEVTPAFLQAWCRQLRECYAVSTVRRYLAALSAPLTVAVRYYKWLPEHPMRDVILPGEMPGRTRYLTDAERAALLEACGRSQNLHLSLVVLLALTTGARKNELMFLRWGDVDLERRQLRFLQTKNKEQRSVPVTGQALEGLLQRRNGQPLAMWVFPRADGLKPVLIEQAWQVARRRARLVDFRFHDLRHSAASYLAMSGATLRDIAEILGHRSIKQTMRYSHLCESHTRVVVERMAERYDLM